MSAITLAVLMGCHRDAVQAHTHTTASVAYRDALQKAPRLVAVAHLVQVAAHLVALAVRVGVRGVPAPGRRVRSEPIGVRR